MKHLFWGDLGLPVIYRFVFSLYLGLGIQNSRDAVHGTYSETSIIRTPLVQLITVLYVEVYMSLFQRV